MISRFCGEKGSCLIRTVKLNRTIQLPALPDLSTILRRHKHGLSLLHIKGFVEGINIWNRAIHPVMSRRVWVSQQVFALVLYGLVKAPNLRPPQEKPLSWSEAVESRSFRTFQRTVVCVPGNVKSAEVCNILTQCQGTVNILFLRGAGSYRTVSPAVGRACEI